jgi:tetratricopeptide (TPR) repeat protein
MNSKPIIPLALLAVLLLAPGAAAQDPPARAPNPRADSLRTAQQLDADGKHVDARAIYQQLIATAANPAAKASATRRLAMSYGYDANCAKVIELEEQVIAYWVTRREAEPQNAHYQEGEMANEAGRVCIDHGFLDEAERMYRRGADLGNAEPSPRTHPKSLWDYRLAHALARVAARRGNAPEAARWVAEARKALDGDSTMAKSQEQYFPYLVGYVALFTGDLATAEAQFTKTVAAMPNDPFQLVLLGMAHEKMGHADAAKGFYRRAYDMSTGSNPPQVYSRTFTRQKLGSP